jgi:acetolactate synthase-1/2/3 large subunit
MPMIMLTGQKAIMTAKQARFQIVDVIASRCARSPRWPGRS